MSKLPASSSRGIFSATRDGTATLLAAARTRLELVGNELKEEKLRAVRLLLLSQLLAFCLALGTVLGVALLVVIHWDNRVLVLACSSAFFFVVAGFAYVNLMRRVRSPGHLFSATLNELAEDIQQIRSSARDESRAD